MTSNGPIASSFRDPSGFVFRLDGTLYRQVNVAYRDTYRRLIDSSLYENLVAAHLLVPHEEVALEPARPTEAWKVIRPEPVDFVSYPYEWCFSQLKDAALATLAIQKRALDFGMSLKDASAYNIQFHRGRPVLIDTLSFEPYREGRPWPAYRQFCQHFLAPLVLMRRTDVRLAQLLRTNIDGVPLDLASRLLPFRTHFTFSALAHIHLHASTQKRYEARPVNTSRLKVSRSGMLALVESLEKAIGKLDWRPGRTTWADYYGETNYSKPAFEHKKQAVAEFLARARPGMVWDLGANTGVFSALAAQCGAMTVAFDSDPAAVEKHYRECRRSGAARILPLAVDLLNPSPSLGWHNHERMSLVERGPADVVMALALVHHLAIGNNVPFDRLAEFFAALCSGWLIVEFVPKSDSQVRRLLASREDVFPDYDEGVFEKSFRSSFTIEASLRLQQSERTLYLMRRLPRAGQPA
ncbi:MAG: class I SAM-dependent methyltransferase [Vicinamibacterales bacterium]